MNTEKKVMFFDIDGTLLESGQKIIAADVLEAIQQARANGHLMFINTGRTLSNLTHHLLNAGFDGYICACGCYILLDGKVALYHHNENNICQIIQSAALKYNMDIVFESWHGIYYSYEQLLTADANALVNELTGVYKIFDRLPEKDFNFDKFVTWNRTDSDIEGFANEISEYFERIDRGNGFNEFVPVGFSKASGIQFILDTYKLPLSAAHAVGDSTNDLPMLKFVPHSIAMGNSQPTSLFDEVEYITSDIDKNGIINALKHYGFI